MTSYSRLSAFSENEDVTTGNYPNSTILQPATECTAKAGSNLTTGIHFKQTHKFIVRLISSKLNIPYQSKVMNFNKNILTGSENVSNHGVGDSH